MNSKLIQVITRGTPEEMDAAAREICQSRMKELVNDLVEQLQHPDSLVRETVAVILGVLGGKESVKHLSALGKSDPETNVRIASIIARENAGKLTYDRLKNEIKRFHHESLSEQEKKKLAAQRIADKSETTERKMPEVKRISGEEIIKEKETAEKISGFLPGLKRIMFTWKAAIVAGFLIVLVLVVFVLNVDREGKFVGIDKPEEFPISGSKAVGLLIKERIAAINKFKSTYLNPDNPASKYPMTLEIRSIPGDTYGDLFDKVYSDIFGTEIGMNTMGAFWRHVNFGTGRTQNLVDLMERETSGELLLFPSPAAMNVILNVEKGSLAFQTINKFDPDLEITIRVDNVVVR